MLTQNMQREEKERQRENEGTHMGKRETPGPLAPLFICFIFFFPSSWAYLM